jgi:hypothetical protein
MNLPQLLDSCQVFLSLRNYTENFRLIKYLMNFNDLVASLKLFSYSFLKSKKWVSSKAYCFDYG